ncbi:hypothetical protein DAPPUDRAFT_123481 [Daphnia pulex]|uniref:Uncharacterized protein n=1 Tax=Daphnia pulex TaxID=6669 RepID=E9I5U7_DAPPU|nr:hypothetical protein DAPPUDRAFT_123481 [Daphnia pulex]|eukprot:EFX60632.1 hypothetical protein DAPPUDRAFT_123481 [Daphnia pulex]
MACFQHGGRLDVRGSALRVGQSVRVLISGLWLPGTIESVCTVPDSYVVRLADGRAFRRTRRDINIDNSSSAAHQAHQAQPGHWLPLVSVDGELGLKRNRTGRNRTTF